MQIMSDRVKYRYSVLSMMSELHATTMSKRINNIDAKCCVYQLEKLKIQIGNGA